MPTHTLSKIAANFGPQEYFALTLFALSMLAFTRGRYSIRSLIGGAVGVLISNVGIHLVTDVERFTLNFVDLSEGIAGPEAANYAATDDAMVPTLALGIPGSGSTAVILAALIMYGFRPGPHLMNETPEFVYAIFTAC